MIVASISVMGFKNREIAVWHSTIDKLDAKRKAVAKAKLQLLGPAISETHEVYKFMKSFPKRSEGDSEDATKVFEEDPLGQFEESSAILKAKLDEWASWVSCLKRERRNLRLAGWINDSAVFGAILSLFLFSAEVDLVFPIIFAVYTLLAVLVSVVILGLHRKGRDKLQDEWDMVTDKEERFLVD